MGGDNYYIVSRIPFTGVSQHAYAIISLMKAVEFRNVRGAV
jgi:hypothetical protein